MAAARTHKRRAGSSRNFVLFGVISIAIFAIISFCMVTTAQGFGEVDSSTIGIGSSQSSTSASTIDPQERLGISAKQGEDGVSEALDPSDGAERSITVKDPDPVLAPIALDYSNPTAVEKASQRYTLNPLPTAPRLTPNLNDGSWSRGVASAYNVASNDDSRGTFGVSTTASGRGIHEGSVTVAVPSSQSYLLGRVVEICYDGKIVIATVTDTGGFGKYGRSLDLAPGVYHAFGFASPADWGTRSIHYRFL